MTKEIKYTTALDENGKTIHIDDAEKGKTYYCPCSDCEYPEFILRKSGKTGPGSRRPHFAHKNPGAKCSPDRVLHDSFIRTLTNLLESYKEEKKAFEIEWYCDVCRKKHKGNLLNEVATIKEEKDLKECRPDISLLDKNGIILKVIEIVVTHEPEENALEYYNKNNIILIQVSLYSDENIKNVERVTSRPDIVDYCLNPNCSKYDTRSTNRKIHGAYERCRL